MSINRNYLVPIGIYLVAFSIVLYYNLSRSLVNDGIWEYLIYSCNLEHGWLNRPLLVNYCIIPTLLPVYVHSVTGVNSYLLFRIWPALFYPLMPVFTYLIARRYFSLKWSLVAVTVLLLNSYFIYFPDVGRVGISLGFMAGMIWAFLGKRIWYLLLFTVLTAFSHYGASVLALALIGGATLLTLLIKKQLIRSGVVVTLVLLLIIGVWFMFMPTKFGGTQVVEAVVTYSEAGKFNKGTSPAVEGVVPSDTKDWVELESREATVQTALGLNFGDLTVPNKVELLSNWAIVGLLTLGLLLMLKNRLLDFNVRSLAFVAYGLVVASVVVPWVSVNYGVTRVLFSSSIVLTLGIPISLQWLGSRLKNLTPFLTALVLLSYGLSTSGIIYRIFGEAKYFYVAAHPQWMSEYLKLLK